MSRGGLGAAAAGLEGLRRRRAMADGFQKAPDKSRVPYMPAGYTHCCDALLSLITSLIDGLSEPYSVEDCTQVRAIGTTGSSPVLLAARMLAPRGGTNGISNDGERRDPSRLSILLVSVRAGPECPAKHCVSRHDRRAVSGQYLWFLEPLPAGFLPCGFCKQQGSSGWRICLSQD